MAGCSPVDRGKQDLKRSGMTDGYGIPPGRVLAGANRTADHNRTPIRRASYRDREYVVSGRCYFL